MIPEELFYHVFESIPRQGPGCSAATKKAFSFVHGLTEPARVLDIGCGKGVQTLDLARLVNGTITAVDNHQQFLDTLSADAGTAGLSGKIRTMNASMDALPFTEKEFDLIWSEGSIFIIGFARGLAAWKPFLADGGFLVVSDSTWFRPDIPDDLRAWWEKMGGGITSEEEKVEEIRKAGYSLVSMFRLPEAGWQKEYYDPMLRIVAGLRNQYASDPALAGVLNSFVEEAEMYRKYAPYYGYTFFVIKK